MPKAKQPKAGDVVIVNFTDATGKKRRPGIVLSSDLYHAQRPDSIIGLITTNLGAATTAMDHLLLDWSAAGLDRPSAFRSYIGMELQSRLHIIGHLSDRDWNAIRDCVRRALV